MKYLVTSLLTLISLSLWASGGPKDALKDLDNIRRGMTVTHITYGYDDDDDDDDYPFSDFDLTPLPFSAINTPPPEICTETPDDQQGSLNGTWPVAESEEGKFQAEIQRLMKQRELEASKTKTFKSDWERLQETASQSGLRRASDPAPERLNLEEFVQMASQADQPLPPTRLAPSVPQKDKPLKRRALHKIKTTRHHHDRYKQRIIAISNLPAEDFSVQAQLSAKISRFRSERVQLTRTLIEALRDRDETPTPSPIQIANHLITRVKKSATANVHQNPKDLIKNTKRLINEKISHEKEALEKLQSHIFPFQSYPAQYVKKVQISSRTPRLSRLGQIYVVPNEDQEIDDLPYEDSDTEVDSPPVARKSQSASD